ncbi:GspH/FimT family pseudopilin [Methylobacter psychrophilus]|uniref:GspH/FimT family pseudopilin n=1 Tax=Methylobacter psychrophilus TaxID=96941 RepID=UPI0021D4C9A9|nr:GspH/FimT family pseudopilin [Methylobacter psychrophilus]
MYTRRKDIAGYTLIEVLVTITIAGILSGIAIPSFTSIIRSNQLTTYANDLVTAFNFARSESVKRGVQLTIRRKGLSNGQWEGGWDIFVDLNGNEFLDDTNSTPCESNTNGSLKEDCLLKTYEALPDGYTLRIGTSTYKDYAAYLPSGLSKVVVSDIFRLCNGTDNTLSRAIKINAIGRTQVSIGTSSCP